jgi:hypothetical protein
MPTTLQELQKQLLELPTSDRRQLAQVLLKSLQWESKPIPQPRNLSRLRGITKNALTGSNIDDSITNY